MRKEFKIFTGFTHEVQKELNKINEEYFVEILKIDVTGNVITIIATIENRDPNYEMMKAFRR